MKNFHLPLPPDVYENLQTTAKRLHKPTTQVARQALEEWLKKQRESAIHEEIADYAAKSAGTAHDLDKDLEDATVDHLLGEES